MLDIELLSADELLAVLKHNPSELLDAVRLAAAMRLYEQGRLSSGTAARLAGIPRVEFLSKLADYGIDTFKMFPEELERDFANALACAR